MVYDLWSVERNRQEDLQYNIYSAEEKHIPGHVIYCRRYYKVLKMYSIIALTAISLYSLACNGQEERIEDTEKKGAFGVPISYPPQYVSTALSKKLYYNIPIQKIVETLDWRYPRYIICSRQPVSGCELTATRGVKKMVF